MLPDHSEHGCETVNASPGGLMIKSAVAPYKGQRIVGYFSELGRIEGTVTRILRDRFAISVKSTMRKLEKTASTLTWLGNRDDLGLPDNRKHERISLTHAFSVVTLPDGRSAPARILDASMEGVAFATQLTIPPDISFKVGSRSARVTRVMNGGYAVAFARPISADEWHRDIVL
ncbi:hypothetical protein CYD53_12152 [Bosea psychrotolerans]|uniref:PilZ domain-containing protein n=2 Tax=Bosea psychrotolerans TaxID=1871628 RepID=A0A2S4LWY7_9HYPH|nr:hypothetical protein CYD53_12152 [Bosea psychrotolerans]